MKNTKQHSPEIDTAISEALFSSFWYNLGFALEWRVEKSNTQENIKQICDDISKVLERSKTNNSKDEIRKRVASVLDEETLREISKEYSEYLDSVKHRAQNSWTFSEL